MTRPALRIAGLATLALLAAACAKPLPADRLDYAGIWTGRDTLYVIRPNGEFEYRFATSNEGVKRSSYLTAPLNRFDGADMLVGVSFLARRFVVSAKPHDAQCVTQMTVDGLVLIKHQADDQGRGIARPIGPGCDLEGAFQLLLDQGTPGKAFMIVTYLEDRAFFQYRLTDQGIEFNWPLARAGRDDALTAANIEFVRRGYALAAEGTAPRPNEMGMGERGFIAGLGTDPKAAAALTVELAQLWWQMPDANALKVEVAPEHVVPQGDGAGR